MIDEREKVVIRRIFSKPAPFAWQEWQMCRCVKVEEGLAVIDGEAMLLLNHF